MGSSFTATRRIIVALAVIGSIGLGFVIGDAAGGGSGTKSPPPAILIVADPSSESVATTPNAILAASPAATPSRSATP